VGYSVLAEFHLVCHSSIMLLFILFYFLLSLSQFALEFISNFANFGIAFTFDYFLLVFKVSNFVSKLVDVIA